MISKLSSLPRTRLLGLAFGALLLGAAPAPAQGLFGDWGWGWGASSAPIRPAPQPAAPAPGWGFWDGFGSGAGTGFQNFWGWGSGGGAAPMPNPGGRWLPEDPGNPLPSENPAYEWLNFRGWAGDASDTAKGAFDAVNDPLKPSPETAQTIEDGLNTVLDPVRDAGSWVRKTAWDTVVGE